LLSEEEFQYYEDGARWRCLESYSEHDVVTKTIECKLKPGSYVFAIDNGYDTSPYTEEIALISIKMEARPVFRT
jgi:hypothetical protein